MSIALIFWIIMLLWLLSVTPWGQNAAGPWGPFGSNLLAFILFLLLGWAEFGAPIRG